MKPEFKLKKSTLQNPTFTLIVINVILWSLVIYIKSCDVLYSIGVEIGQLLAK